MDKKDLLLKRLDDIGKSLKKTGEAKALLALGSIGTEIERMDKYSDLDFFVIVNNGKKQRFIENLDWLTDISETNYYFLNTKDGYKLLYKDGVYCEFAVFEEYELKDIPFSEGRVVWKIEGFDEKICIPSKNSEPWKPQSFEWALNEAITCLYVGLCRFARGEKISGMRFVQNYAVDMLLASASYMYQEEKDFIDKYQHERRFENRYPELADYLPKFIQGYEKTPESAIEILKFIEEKYSVNQDIKNEIIKLVEEIKSK